jgi:hypothetical protein
MALENKWSPESAAFLSEVVDETSADASAALRDVSGASLPCAG